MQSAQPFLSSQIVIPITHVPPNLVCHHSCLPSPKLVIICPGCIIIPVFPASTLTAPHICLSQLHRHPHCPWAPSRTCHEPHLPLFLPTKLRWCPTSPSMTMLSFPCACATHRPRSLLFVPRNPTVVCPGHAVIPSLPSSTPTSPLLVASTSLLPHTPV
jgi:hypothetical protein